MMGKRILSVSAVLLILAISVLPAFAVDNSLSDGLGAALAASSYGGSLLVDDAGLLTDSEKQMLLASLNDISERQQCSVVIVTVTSLGGKTATEYADDYFDYNGYGYGTEKDGILFLIDMGSRSWAISTRGYGITAFTDAGQAYIMEQVEPSLSSSEYYTSFTTFASMCDDFLTQAKAGKPYDSDNLPREENIALRIIVAIGIGVVAAFIVTASMKGKLKSVRFSPAASDYVKPGSLNVRNGSEVFLYTKVNRVPIPKNNGSGGSSTHTSSSGATHGGSSGRF